MEYIIIYKLYVKIYFISKIYYDACIKSLHCFVFCVLGELVIKHFPTHLCLKHKNLHLKEHLR